MVPEAPLAETEAGLVAAGPGWFVVNARDARWFHREGRGERLPFTGWTDDEVAKWFPQLGVSLYVLPPGEPIGMYHGEADQEDFLVLAGECVLVVEDEERPLKQWDFIHCPPWTEHIIIGAGDRPAVVLGVGGRSPGGIRYPRNETAARHGASVEQETTEPREAYARFPAPEETRYREGWLPG